MRKVLFTVAAVSAIATHAMAAETKPCREKYTFAGEQNSHAKYLQAKSIEICGEGNRILDQSSKMRAESAKLDFASERLRKEADYLDFLWNRAHSADPDSFQDFVGRDRSQRIMRHDVGVMSSDVEHLRNESERLVVEASRLWKLAERVDAEAVEERGKRFTSGRPLTKTDVATLRSKIIAMAEAVGTRYIPH